MSISLSITIKGPDELSKKLKDRIVRQAISQGMSVSELMIQAAEDYLRKKGQKP